MIFVSVFVALMVTLISLLIFGGAFWYWISQFGFGEGVGEPWLNIPDGEVWQLPIPFSFPLTTSVTYHTSPPIHPPEHPPFLFQFQLYLYTLKMVDTSTSSPIMLQIFLSNSLIFLQLLGLVVGIIITSFYEVFLKR
jgi:hypothetical protein